MHVKVKPSSDGLYCLKGSDDEASHDENHPSSSYLRRFERTDVDSNYQLTRDREKRIIKPTMRFRYAYFIRYPLTITKRIECSKPRSFKTAIKGLKVQQWKVAMEEENEPLKKNHTWTHVNLPRNQKVVGCKRVFMKKEEILDVEKQF